jgi:uncharacterized protein (DUF1697 family)
MPRYVALLRSVNVGGRSLSMATLRDVAESLGHTEVSTYIQSGNLLFTAKRAVPPKQLESAISKELGMDVPVVLRTAAELARVIERDPFPKADRSKVHVGFMAAKPPAAAVEQVDHDRFAPEECAVKGCEVYFHLPNGMGRSKLPTHVGQKLKVPTTVRNWNTVTKLLELLTAG